MNRSAASSSDSAAAQRLARAGARWFSAFADAGHATQIDYWVREASGVERACPGDHREVDGIAGLLRRLPGAQRASAPHRFDFAPARGLAALRAAARRQQHPIAWVSAPAGDGGAAHAIAAYDTVPERGRVSGRRAFIAAHRVLMADTVSGASPRGDWMVPVDLRAHFGPSEGNAASFAIVSAGRSDEESVLDDAWRKLAKSPLPRTLAALQLGAAWLPGVAARAARKQHVPGHWWGVYSHLGRWTDASGRALAFSPFVTRARPLAFGSVIVDDQVGLAVRAHAHLGGSACAQRLLAAWRHALAL